jgi:cell division septum initiation protein DivIVA
LFNQYFYLQVINNSSSTYNFSIDITKLNPQVIDYLVILSKYLNKIGGLMELSYLLAIIAVISIVVIVEYSKRISIEKKYNSVSEFLEQIIADNEQLNTNMKVLVKEHDAVNSELESWKGKYSQVFDIDKHCNDLLAKSTEDANSIISRAKNAADNTRSSAAKILEEAESTASYLIDNAKEESKKVRLVAFELKDKAAKKLEEATEKSNVIVSDARVESDKIIEFAKKHAEDIAGDAYEAKHKADQYENAIIAMKNTIEGYRDEYIVPNHSVLDDLADEYSHKEAGKQLAETRTRIRNMIRDGVAAECDYVEAVRRNYAIHFAVDAFNGKVDSALSKVKSDNYGKIQQEILDAFSLVNHNGSAFRNARIREEYLHARLTELKWAVATHELREKEKQEQAEIRAQIREEERVLKEIEKARKEAEKEERILQKALDKARKELEEASAEQKAVFEAQLFDLEQKLKEAEEKGQRALSMAQQTRRGHVYVISNIGSFGETVYKIGMTRRLEPLDRVKELGDASVPFPFDVHAMIFSEDAPSLEKTLHQVFERDSMNKVNRRKEFFKTSVSLIKQAVEQHGISEVHWTMKAEAVEYRETLAIEREMQQETAA